MRSIYTFIPEWPEHTEELAKTEGITGMLTLMLTRIRSLVIPQQETTIVIMVFQLVMMPKSNLNL